MTAPFKVSKHWLTCSFKPALFPILIRGMCRLGGFTRRKIPHVPVVLSYGIPTIQSVSRFPIVQGSVLRPIAAIPVAQRRPGHHHRHHGDLHRGVGHRSGSLPRLARRRQRIRERRHAAARHGRPAPVDLHHLDVPAPADLAVAHPVQHAYFVVRGARAGTHDGALAVPRAVRAVRIGRRYRTDGVGRVLAVGDG